MRSPSLLAFFIVCVAVAASAASAAPATKLAEQAIFISPDGNGREDSAIARWQQRARDDTTPLALERLGWAFVSKARATLDDGYYTLALLTTDVLASRHGATPGGRLLRGHVLLNVHRFREAEALARDLVASGPSPYHHALLSDALLEQGRIDEAVVACQRFVDAHPGLQAYARVAHLRWLTGDLPGAAAAMTAAVHAGSPRDGETHAWALVRLAHYYLQLGQADRALQLTDSALQARADFAPALLGRGQALLALGRASDAVAPLQRAVEQAPLPVYQWWLADAQRTAGDAPAASKTEAAMARHAARSDARTFALYLATRGQDARNAVTLARRELESRADPHTLDALAWALLAAGDLAAADATMKRVLAAGTNDPRFHLHAASIARAAGRPDEARDRLSRAEAHAAALTPSERERLVVERAALARNSTS